MLKRNKKNPKLSVFTRNFIERKSVFALYFKTCNSLLHSSQMYIIVSLNNIVLFHYIFLAGTPIPRIDFKVHVGSSSFKFTFYFCLIYGSNILICIRIKTISIWSLSFNSVNVCSSSQYCYRDKKLINIIHEWMNEWVWLNWVTKVCIRKSCCPWETYEPAKSVISPIVFYITNPLIWYKLHRVNIEHGENLSLAQ